MSQVVSVFDFEGSMMQNVENSFAQFGTEQILYFNIKIQLLGSKNYFSADEAMIIHDKNRYFQILEQFEIVPYTQSRGWYEMHSLYKPESIIFIVNDLENPTIACFAHVKRSLG